MYFVHPLLVSLFAGFFILGEEGGCAIALVGRRGDAKNGGVMIFCVSLP